MQQTLSLTGSSLTGFLLNKDLLPAKCLVTEKPTKKRSYQMSTLGVH